MVFKNFDKKNQCKSSFRTNNLLDAKTCEAYDETIKNYLIRTLLKIVNSSFVFTTVTVCSSS